jgi:branched-chain amino acid transport system substrate-binding protein
MRMPRLANLSRWIPAAIVIAGVFMLSGLPARSAPGYEARTAAGEAWSERGFSVAVVWPKRERPDFVEGVKLAWEEIDRGKGPLAGKIRLREYVESESAEEGGLALKVAMAGDVMVALGHAVPEHVVPASLVYERHSVLFITTEATDPRSTNHRFQYVFRLTPNDEQIAAVLARFAHTRGYKRVGVLYARTNHGETASRAFIAKATPLGIHTAFLRSYHPVRGNWRSRDFRQLAAEVRSFDVDALLVADALPAGGKLVHDLIRMGVTQPILGTDKLEPDGLRRIAGEHAAQFVHVATAFDPSSATPEYTSFRERFKARYRAEPSYAAAQGYESFMLAARASLASRTAAPLVLATTMRLAPSWNGLFGAFSFRHEGDIAGRRISIARIADGRLLTEYTREGAEE